MDFVKGRIQYVVSHPMYKMMENSIILTQKDSLNLETFMIPNKYKELKTVSLKGAAIIDTAYGSKELNVLDFEVVGQDSLLLLAYEKSKNKSNVLLFGVNQKEQQRMILSNNMKELIRDYRGNIHVLSEDTVLKVTIGKRLKIKPISKAYYLSYLAPIVDTTTTKQILSNQSDFYPAFEYFTMDFIDSSYRRITQIQDDWMMELYRSEYKWVDVRTKLWAKEKELESGIDAEVWVGANYFTRSLYWKEVYAPMFQRNDSIYIFNYPKDRLERYDKNGLLIESLGLYHHYQSKKSGFKRSLLQDPITGAVFAVFEKDGFSYVGPISLTTGEISNKYKLGFKYVEKIKIYNNKVYYVYRPFESLQKRFLYAERLPYKFRQAYVNKDYLKDIDTGK